MADRGERIEPFTPGFAPAKKGIVIATSIASKSKRQHREEPGSREPGFFFRKELLRDNLLVGIDNRKDISVVTAFQREGLVLNAVDRNGLSWV